MFEWLGTYPKVLNLILAAIPTAVTSGLAYFPDWLAPSATLKQAVITGLVSGGAGAYLLTLWLYRGCSYKSRKKALVINFGAAVVVGLVYFLMLVCMTSPDFVSQYAWANEIYTFFTLAPPLMNFLFGLAAFFVGYALSTAVILPGKELARWLKKPKSQTKRQKVAKPR